MDIESNFNIELNVKHHNFRSDYQIGNFLYLTAQLIRNKLTDLQDFIDGLNYQVHVILITETWIL